MLQWYNTDQKELCRKVWYKIYEKEDRSRIDRHSSGLYLLLCDTPCCEHPRKRILGLSGGLVLLILVIYGFRKRVTSIYQLRSDKVLKGGLVLLLAVIIVYGVGALLSSPVVNAKKYQALMEPEERNFADDIKEISYDQIPLLDKDSAELLGNRKMGSMVDMVSQFEVSSLYSQINYKEQPYRISPLVYASPIKWLTNQKDGIPAYVLIDMATQNTELVKLDKGIKYSESEYFNRNIYRHLRFKYPTYMFDQLSFEIDDEGTPYWICPVKKFNIGLFGGQTIGRVVLCNAQTGECQDLKIEDCPKWVDRAYPADLLVELYDIMVCSRTDF